MAAIASSETNQEEELSTLRAEIEKKTGKTPEQLYEERERRVTDALQLREPDRVPVTSPTFCYFAIRYAGLLPSAAYYEPGLYRRAFIQAVVDFEPDVWRGLKTYAVHSGLAMEALDDKQVLWPGGTLPSDVTNQYIERDDMKEDEYDLFITDPTDFIIRRYLARVYGSMEPCPGIPKLGLGLLKSGLVDLTATLSGPEFRKVARAFVKAGREEARWRRIVDTVQEDLTGLGFPPLRYSGGVGEPPMDYIAARLRGLRGVMTDIFKRPQKVITACERILEWELARAAPADPTQKWNPRRVSVGNPHYGSDDFMSMKQFETFYWPTWKRAILATIELGFFPLVFFEGKADDRVEYMLELPRRKFSLMFERGNMAMAKQILGNHCGLIGGIPPALLKIASPQEVDDFCKDLIKTCGKGGGFMLGCNSSADDAKPANVRAMIDAVKKHGRY